MGESALRRNNKSKENQDLTKLQKLPSVTSMLLPSYSTNQNNPYTQTYKTVGVYMPRTNHTISKIFLKNFSDSTIALKLSCRGKEICILSCFWN
ncbi:hypothetical protein PR048_014619 [Dryococelus australis]|uniref:Uncharacterized protein n=1 Tax=Dryococelus australis TaxID=614101 RepID=A0ABQ9HEY4_9NEOP|nr:hypothetical protein PR048_014619 [Dryococelus australis]